jgi:hypothetical protein
VKHLALSGAALFALTLTSASGAQAAETVCSAIWSPDGSIPPGGTKSAPIQGSNPPCPVSSIVATVNIGNLGSFIGPLQWGNLWTQYPTTSNTAILLGSPASSSTDFELKFDKPTPNPYFYVDALNAVESITFYTPFVILQSKGISVNGLTITGSGVSNRDVGFVAQFLGDYSQINFKHINTTSAYGDSFGFTTGANANPVPAPLPILGVGAALSQCRKLRRLSNQLHNRRVNLG